MFELDYFRPWLLSNSITYSDFELLNTFLLEWPTLLAYPVVKVAFEAADRKLPLISALIQQSAVWIVPWQAN